MNKTVDVWMPDGTARTFPASALKIRAALAPLGLVLDHAPRRGFFARPVRWPANVIAFPRRRMVRSHG